MPSGMVAVSQEQFFAALKADSRDIMPSARMEYETPWEDAHRNLWGWSSTGYKSGFGAEEIYAVYPPAIAAAKGAAA